jgi:methionyl-tRNA formyltransferase
LGGGANAPDGIAWSLNNKFILGDELLGLPVTFFNVHNGLVQRRRGIPEVCVFFAVLEGDPEYGPTLHVIDRGIDTGPVVAQMPFALGPDDTFGSVMERSLARCASLFEENVDRIAAGSWPECRVDRTRSRLFSYRTLAEAEALRGSPAFARAASLAPYEAFFPRLSEWVHGGGGAG